MVALLDSTWRKSTYSGNNGSCVEVRRVAATVEVRDTKNREGYVLRFAAETWQSFVTGVNDGEFDRP